jgi:hypothetical protein
VPRRRFFFVSFFLIFYCCESLLSDSCAVMVQDVISSAFRCVDLGEFAVVRWQIASDRFKKLKLVTRRIHLDESI